MAKSRKELTAKDRPENDGIPPGIEVTPGCWIDVYESPNYIGKLRRIFGPALYLNLCDSTSANPVRIVSLIVGPAAYAQLFAQRRPERGAVWVVPRQQVPDLLEIKVDQELNSIRVLSRPPFPYEPGYSGFVRQMGRQHPEATPVKKKRGGRGG